MTRSTIVLKIEIFYLQWLLKTCCIILFATLLNLGLNDKNSKYPNI